MPRLPLAPNDLCGCGNGKRYADCHMRVHAAAPDQRIAVAQAMYAEEWASNAEHYRQQGIYADLAAELVSAGRVRRVLDIGCGQGEGIYALRELIPPKGRLIIGVDENPECLAAAAARLGINVDDAHLRRTTFEILPSGAYRLRATGDNLPTAKDVTLLNVDLMLKDKVFEAWLDDIGPLDAVTLWFSGIHKARAETELAQANKISNDRLHRECLEDIVIQLAGQRLRQGGFLHIVVRGAGTDLEALRNDFGAEFCNALDAHPLEIVNVNGRRYTEPEAGNAVVVTSKTVPTGAATAAFSLLARRH